MEDAHASNSGEGEITAPKVRAITPETQYPQLASVIKKPKRQSEPSRNSNPYAESGFCMLHRPRSTAAARQRRKRERHKVGLAVFRIEFDEVALADALATAGLLSFDKADDRKAVSAALRQAVEIFVQSKSL